MGFRSPKRSKMTTFRDFMVLREALIDLAIRDPFLSFDYHIDPFLSVISFVMVFLGIFSITILRIFPISASL